MNNDYVERETDILVKSRDVDVPAASMTSLRHGELQYVTVMRCLVHGVQRGPAKFRARLRPPFRCQAEVEWG